MEYHFKIFAKISNSFESLKKKRKQFFSEYYEQRKRYSLFDHHPNFTKNQIPIYF